MADDIDPFGDEEDPELDISPLIDVAFLLLIYFLVTFSAAEILSFLDISRPAPDAASSGQPPADMIRVAVLERGYVINGREVSRAQLEDLVNTLAAVSTKQTVLVNCSNDSQHGRLVAVLDMCAANGLTQIAVVSGRKP